MIEIEEMTGAHLVMTEIEEMIGDTTGTGEMTGGLHLDMIEKEEMKEDLLVMTVTEEMKEAMRAEAGEMIAMDGMIMKTGMTVQDHLGTREPLLNHHR